MIDARSNWSHICDRKPCLTVDSTCLLFPIFLVAGFRAGFKDTGSCVSEASNFNEKWMFLVQLSLLFCSRNGIPDFRSRVSR